MVYAYVKWLKKSWLKTHTPVVLQFSVVVAVILYSLYCLLYPLYAPFSTLWYWSRDLLYPLYAPFPTLWYWSRDLIYTTARKLKLWILSPPPPKPSFVTTVFSFVRVRASRFIMVVHALSGSPLFTCSPIVLGLLLHFLFTWLLSRED
ncbi:hypothetical protein HanHA300_Chr01g0028751 [Helianthus annuus]|nr:hypothetical protein HanHA300_Chr01g0028751 [Helianthus annuus]KAJ0793386.1 hypothetical protein HanOQP8_Chr01g0029001 [Helianthus annuus]